MCTLVLRRSITITTLISCSCLFSEEIQRANTEQENTEKANPHNFSLSGYIIVGADNLDNVFYRDEKERTEFFLRKAKVGFDYTWAQDWEATIEITAEQDQDDFDVNFGDVFIEHDLTNHSRFRVGYQKEPFGFERLIGQSKLHTSERSLSTQAFTNNRNFGITYSIQDDSWSWHVAISNDDNYSNTAIGLLNSASYFYEANKNTWLYMGISHTYRTIDSQEFQIKETAGSYFGDTVVRSAKFLADNEQKLALSALWNWERFYLMSEYYGQNVEQVNQVHWNYSGFYLQAGLFLTPDNLKIKKGKLRTIKPSGSNGALEWTLRYNETDLFENGVGSVSEIIETGMNYYYAKNVVVKFHLSKVKLAGDLLTTRTNGNSAQLRALYTF